MFVRAPVHVYTGIIEYKMLSIFNIHLIAFEMHLNTFILTPFHMVALRLIFTLDCGRCLTENKINPYEYVFEMLLRGPPIRKNGINRDDYKVKELWLQQPLDHFDPLNNDTWMMRYLVNDNFYRAGAPMFVFVGGEWEISPHVLQSGHFYDMARQQQGLMFYTEHRFYGRSWPRNNSSSDSLKFLSVLQSLEDLKCFLTIKKASTKVLHDAKVVLVGGSYSGSMVSWFMNLYPKLANVAWASSAPLKAKMDFSEYMTFVRASIYRKGGFTCGQKLAEAFNGLSQIMQTEMAYRVLHHLKICKSFDIKNPLDRQAFFNGLGNYFASLVQSFSALIPQFCSNFTHSNETDATEALIKYLAQVFVTSTEIKIREQQLEEENYCLDFSYNGMSSIFANENDLKTGTRPWFYQTCHEFGWFTTTSPTVAFTNQTASAELPLAFGGLVPLSYFLQLCQDVYGNTNGNSAEDLSHGNEPTLTLQQLHERASAINKLFGGFSKVSKRVIFTHGSLDPWRAVGLQSGQNVLLITDYSHVEDMGSIDFSDTVEMNVVKLKVAAFINRFLRHH